MLKGSSVSLVVGLVKSTVVDVGRRGGVSRHPIFSSVLKTRQKQSQHILRVVVV